MIKSVKIIGGVLEELNIFPKEIEFSDGVNIIFAPKGSGKSIFLNSLEHRFPTRYPQPLQYRGFGKQSWNDYLSQDINQLEVDYNGGIVYHFDNFSIQDSRGNFARAQEGNGDFHSAVLNIINKPSSGQKSLMTLNGFLNLPRQIQFPKKSGNEMWERAQQNFIDFYSQFPLDSKPTLLLDELDASLDPDKQLLYLDSVLSTLSQTFQIICVTHNPLVLFIDWYKIHNFYPDQSKELMSKMQWLFNKRSK